MGPNRLFFSCLKLRALTNSKLQLTTQGYTGRTIIPILEWQKETLQRKELAHSNGKLVGKLQTDTCSSDFTELIKLHPRNKKFEYQALLLSKELSQ